MSDDATAAFHAGEQVGIEWLRRRLPELAAELTAMRLRAEAAEARANEGWVPFGSHAFAGPCPPVVFDESGYAEDGLPNWEHLDYERFADWLQSKVAERSAEELAALLAKVADAIEAENLHDAMTDLQEGYDAGLDRAAAIVRAWPEKPVPKLMVAVVAVVDCPGGPHRWPEGPNEDAGQCPTCFAVMHEMRPPGETFGLHLPDCSLPIDHASYCYPGGTGHPPAAVIRGHWPGIARLEESDTPES